MHKMFSLSDLQHEKLAPVMVVNNVRWPLSVALGGFETRHSGIL